MPEEIRFDGGPSREHPASLNVSLCMIAKNESKYIGNCLRSVRPFVDEIIVVDTGSTDDTKEICREHGAIVLEYAWRDDFASARNVGLQHATGDWIFWLDADEEVDQGDAQKLRDYITGTRENFVAIRLINYYGDTPDVDESFQIAHVRLFKNHRGIQFDGKIHERLNIGDVKKIVDIPVRIYHYGYMSGMMKEKGKYERNIRLLEKELQEEDHSPWVHYHIASEYFNVQRYEEAFQHVNACIIKFLLKALQPPALVYRLKYLILLNTGSVDSALAGIDKAIQMYPDYVDLHFFKGISLFTKERYEEAEQTLQRCIEIGEDNWSYLTMKGVGSFQAWYYKGLCLGKLGRADDAAYALGVASDMSPKFKNVHTPL
jgi:glycosyltransferase involved in cell wall biosynthesis